MKPQLREIKLNSKIRKEIYSNLENAFFESQPAICLELKVVLLESVSEILLVKFVSLIERLHFNCIFLAEKVRELTHRCQFIGFMSIVLENFLHTKRLERLFSLSFVGFSSLRRGFRGKFIFLLLHLIHKELVLFIKEQLDDKDVFGFSHEVVQRFLVVIMKKCSRQSDVIHDLGLNIDAF